MRVVVGIWLIAGCGQPLPARPSQPAPIVATKEAVEIPRAGYDVVPAELGDDRVFERVRHRAIVRRWEVAKLRDDGMQFGTSGKPDRANDIQPVIGERARDVRIVVEDDDARFAAWIPRGDLADTALAPVQLVDRAGALQGIWIEPGLPLAAGARVDRLREVKIVDDELAVEGFAPARAVGQVWVAGAGEAPLRRFGRTAQWSPPRDPRPAVQLANGAVVRAAPGAAAGVVATVLSADLVAAVVAKGPVFTELELVRPHLRVRGFVANEEAIPSPENLVVHGTGSGHGFGMSHATTHEVPRGTCLYDQVDGDVVGVTLDARQRLGGPVGEDGWAVVYIGTPWAVVSMRLRNVGTDPAQPPTWDSCSEPAHRR